MENLETRWILCTTVVWKMEAFLFLEYHRMEDSWYIHYLIMVIFLFGIKKLIYT